MATKSPCEKVAAVVRTWDQCGADAKDFDPKMPKHPEFVYRKSGHWKGWAHFLDVAETAESTDRDTLEDRAWAQYREVGGR
jgi:hypothetical protein